MLCRLVGFVIVVLAVVNQSLAFEVGALIRKIDAEKQVALVFANGQDRTVKIAADVKIQDDKGAALRGGLAAPELKEGSRVTLVVENIRNRPTIVAIRLGGQINPPPRPKATRRASVGKPTVGFKPLTEMTAEDRYQGEDGGLYGEGQNTLPPGLRTVADRESTKIVPRDADGNPSAEGRIVLVSISMSNATQEFSRFKQLADADSEKSPEVQVVDCAQGGQTMARWADPRAGCWSEAKRRLTSAGVTPEQVQVAWIKLANAGPRGELREHGKQLERDTRTVLSNLRDQFPNLRIAYLGSRIYGGYADGRLNPEPYAYEGAFVVRWLIQSQLATEAGSNDEPGLGPVKRPLLLWGPYLWADGVKPRQADGLVWLRSDLVGDGTHPSHSGRQKVAEQLLKFFKTDTHARTWFLK